MISSYGQGGGRRQVWLRRPLQPKPRVFKRVFAQPPYRYWSFLLVQLLQYISSKHQHIEKSLWGEVCAFPLSSSPWYSLQNHRVPHADFWISSTCFVYIILQTFLPVAALGLSTIVPGCLATTHTATAGCHYFNEDDSLLLLLLHRSITGFVKRILGHNTYMSSPFPLYGTVNFWFPIPQGKFHTAALHTAPKYLGWAGGETALYHLLVPPK